MRKLGILLMVLVLALGSLGVGYAAWMDFVYVEGTVETGNVDLVVENYSGTWVYKMPEHGIDVVTGWVDEVVAPANYVELVASAVSTPGAGGENDPDVVMTFDNLFPGVLFCADFLVHYIGSVPAIVDADIVSDDEWLNELWDEGYAYWEAWDADGNKIEGPVQLHYCDTVTVKLCIEIPQDNKYMNLTGSFNGFVRAVNWNEWATHPID
ncbi:MAG: hypothetical protein PHQ10_05910 [Dehalococcoidales bacterium]|nr:hypothetical protein [Dehalococcoidales bacterium]MDD3265043.1 hypothetical protein [Dehalococcoidales bacterium]MDD4322847.1 hypothetical protein [Dehalococcoidales bacterium]MDD4794607.1 hypothetical protein [Dehalococcoidales bacterium]MDD5498874.1 hypothetical protein [Dehalococcoidales bacterium]